MSPGYACQEPVDDDVHDRLMGKRKKKSNGENPSDSRTKRRKRSDAAIEARRLRVEGLPLCAPLAAVTASKPETFPEVLHARADGRIPPWLWLPFGKGPSDGFIRMDPSPWRPTSRTNEEMRSTRGTAGSMRAYYELCNRIGVLHAAIDDARRRRDRTLEEALVLWSDRYLPAAVGMDESGRYDDLHWYDSLKWSTFPEPKLAFERARCVPRLEEIISRLKANGRPPTAQNEGTPFGHPVDEAVASVLHKAAFAPGRYRGFGGGEIRDALRDPAHGPTMCDVISRVIVAAMLGSHSEARVCAEFHVRYETYRWYSRFSADADKLLDFVSKHEILFSSFVRESVFVGCVAVPAYEAAISRIIRWSSLKAKTFEFADLFRAKLNDTCKGAPIRARVVCDDVRFHLDDAAGGMATEIAKYNKAVLELSNRPPDTDVASLVVKTVGARDGNAPRDSTAIAIEADLDRLFAEQPNVSLDVARRALDFDRDCRFAFAAKCYELGISRTAIVKALAEMAKRSPREYAAVRGYYERVVRSRLIQFVALPLHLAALQVAAIRADHGAALGDPLPEAAGAFHVCFNCGVLKCGLIKGEHSACGKEARKIVYDVVSGKTYCRRAVDRTKNFERIDARKSHNASNSSLFKTKRADDGNVECRDSVPALVSLVGVVLVSEIHKTCVTLCPSCLAPFSFDRASFYRGEFACIPCQEASEESCPKTRARSCEVCKKRVKASEGAPSWYVSGSRRPELVLGWFCQRHDPDACFPDFVPGADDLKKLRTSEIEENARWLEAQEKRRKHWASIRK